MKLLLRKPQPQHILFFAVLTAALHCSAKSLSTPASVTGTQLLQLTGPVDPKTVHWTPHSKFSSRTIAADFRQLVNGEFVHGYIQAVRDATEGKEWCWGEYKPNPDELEADARQSLARMPDTKLRQNAATLIAEIWRAKFPCADRPRKP
ncbi:hypothetical protein GCM10027321_31800 [Massilia terrae]|uniref:Rap1a immunity protein domain-containing protein n=1 Tax=Massilia terrae TaxID=1811224 RepID=A0ABT2CTQ1_9BURK|nr:Rap1a/Tai family immunity protein [Massilia terrae]MCS0656483.1 hypothetical protein [Massilia terrae]